MSPNRNELSRLELVKAGKLEERHSPRQTYIQSSEAVTAEDNNSSKLRKELIAIALLVIVLLIVAAAGF